MEEKKKVIDLTEEELLASLGNGAIPKEESLDELDTESYRNDILGFIHAFQLKTGENRIKTSALYRLYKFWSLDPVSRRLLTSEISEFIKLEDGYFFVDKDSIKIKILINEARRKNLYTKIPSYKKHFDTFMNKHGLVKGNLYVSSWSLYNLYDGWTFKTRIKNVLSYRSFTDFCNMYFPKRTICKMTSTTLYYGLEKTEILKHLTMDQLDDIQGKRNREKKEDTPKQE